MREKKFSNVFSNVMYRSVHEREASFVFFLHRVKQYIFNIPPYYKNTMFVYKIYFQEFYTHTHTHNTLMIYDRSTRFNSSRLKSPIAFNVQVDLGYLSFVPFSKRGSGNATV